MSYTEYLVNKGVIKLHNLYLKANDPLGLEIAKALKVHCNGYQDEMKKYWFTDDKTESSFCAGSVEEGRAKLEKMKSSFKKGPIHAS